MLQEAGVDICDVSAGQTSIDAHPVYGRMFQTPFSDRIRNETGMATMAVGNIFEPDHVNSILMAGRADLVCLARPHLADPYWTLHAAAKLGDRGEALAAALSRRPRSALPAVRQRRAGNDGGVTMSLDGKHALVTGGGSGIGAAIAFALARAGASVTICGRRRAELEFTAERHNNIHAETADVTDEASIAQLYQQAQMARGKFSIVVANAGMAESAPAEKISRELWSRITRRQSHRRVFLGAAGASRHARAKWGRIVFIASTAGLKGYPYVAPYVAAKHGVVGLARALALETAKAGITVNAVCPGFTETSLLDRAVDRIAARTNLQRSRHASGARGATIRRDASFSRKKSPIRSCGCAAKAAPPSPARRSQCREARHGERAVARPAPRSRQQGAAAAVDQAAARQPADRRR